MMALFFMDKDPTVQIDHMRALGKRTCTIRNFPSPGKASLCMILVADRHISLYDLGSR